MSYDSFFCFFFNQHKISVTKTFLFLLAYLSVFMVFGSYLWCSVCEWIIRCHVKTFNESGLIHKTGLNNLVRVWLTLTWWWHCSRSRIICYRIVRTSCTLEFHTSYSTLLSYRNCDLRRVFITRHVGAAALRSCASGVTWINVKPSIYVAITTWNFNPETSCFLFHPTTGMHQSAHPSPIPVLAWLLKFLIFCVVISLQ